MMVQIHANATTTPKVRAEIQASNLSNAALARRYGVTVETIEHRLTPPRRPQTNGMVERFNGRISDILRTHHSDSSEDLEATLRRYVHLYTHDIPQRALGHRTPIDTLSAWQSERPDLFVKQV